MSAAPVLHSEAAWKFVQRLAIRRREKRYTQLSLGVAIGLDNKMVSRWECGEQLPRVQNLIALCEVLGVSADWLLGIER